MIINLFLEIIIQQPLLIMPYFVFQAVIFVIDSSNKERLSEAQGELVKLISEEILKDACLLILANKQVIIKLRVKLCYFCNH